MCKACAWCGRSRLPNGVETRTVAFPLAITGYEFEVRRPPPELGAHTEEVVLEWLGQAARFAQADGGYDAVTKFLKIDRDETATKLMLNRPDKANALSVELVEALLAAVAAACGDGTRLLVLRGEGKNFCAGFDFSDLEQQSDGDLLHRFVRMELLLQALYHAPMATLALCHGGDIRRGRRSGVRLRPARRRSWHEVPHAGSAVRRSRSARAGWPAHRRRCRPRYPGLFAHVRCGRGTTPALRRCRRGARGLG